jgi:hypothetical protein
VFFTFAQEQTHSALGKFPGAISFKFQERALLPMGNKDHMICSSLEKGTGEQNVRTHFKYCFQ